MKWKGKIRKGKEKVEEHVGFWDKGGSGKKTSRCFSSVVRQFGIKRCHSSLSSFFPPSQVGKLQFHALRWDERWCTICSDQKFFLLDIFQMHDAF